MKISMIPAFPFTINLQGFIFSSIARKWLEEPLPQLSKSTSGEAAMTCGHLLPDRRDFRGWKQTSFSGGQINGFRDKPCYVSFFLLSCKHSCVTKQKQALGIQREDGVLLKVMRIVW